MKFLKKNQIIIYVIALMLVTAGYLNYTTNQGGDTVQTSLEMESDDDSKLADIGDATLVSSNDVVSENNLDTNITQNSITDTNTISNNTTNNTDNTTSQTSSDVSSDYFVKSKLERDTMYSQMLETYDKILNSTNSLETQKQSATEEIKKINDTKNSIMICENLIKTKGFENSVIFVNGDSVSVIVGASELNKEEVAQIQNIISREMSTEIDNIHISNKS